MRYLLNLLFKPSTRFFLVWKIRVRLDRALQHQHRLISPANLLKRHPQMKLEFRLRR